MRVGSRGGISRDRTVLHTAAGLILGGVVALEERSGSPDDRSEVSPHTAQLAGKWAEGVQSDPDPAEGSPRYAVAAWWNAVVDLPPHVVRALPMLAELGEVAGAQLPGGESPSTEHIDEAMTRFESIATRGSTAL